MTRERKSSYVLCPTKEHHLIFKTVQCESKNCGCDQKIKIEFNIVLFEFTRWPLLLTQKARATPLDIITEETPVQQQSYDVKALYLIYKWSCVSSVIQIVFFCWTAQNILNTSETEIV